MLLRKYIQYLHFAARRPVFIGVVIVLLLLTSLPIVDITVDSNGEGWLPKDSKQLTLKNQFIKDFGNDELMLLYLTFPDSSSSSYRMLVLKKTSDSITSSIHGFDNVFSRYNVSQIAHIMGKGYSKKLERSYFNPSDSLGEMIFLKVRLNKNINALRPLLIDSLHIVLKKVLSTDVKIHLSGQGVIFNEIDKLSSKDSEKLFELCFALIFIVMWWQLRKFNYLLIWLLLVVLSLIPSLSLFGWLHIPINMITMMVPLLFIINFSSFAVHILTKQSNNTKRYVSKKLPPIIASTLATIIGFGSLTTSNIKLISQFGILTSLGILWGLIILLFVGVPIVLRLIKINRLVLNSNWLNNLLDWYYKKLSNSFSFILLGVMIVLILAGIFVFPKIKVDTNAINFIKPDNEVRQTVEYIEKHFGSANVVDFLIVKKNNTPINDEDLKLIRETNKQLLSLPFVKSVIGFDLWRPFIHSITSTDPVLAQQLTAGFFTSDKCRSRMIVNIPSGSVKEMDNMLHVIQAKIDHSLAGSTIEIKPVGFLPLYVEQMSTIVDGMLYGLSIAVVLIFIVMTVLVRDLKLGLITIVITVFPLCGVAILMKILNIQFDVGTSIISSVAIGMIADDALHIIWNYKRHIKNRRSNNQLDFSNLFADSVRKIVFPCTATSFMFSVGFLILMLSNMITIIDFGILSAATIILAWISDFIFFPALLTIFYKVR